VEAALGRRRFVVLYLLAALGGSVCSYLFGPVLVASVGASGAILGVIGAWFSLARAQRSDTAAIALLIAFLLAYSFYDSSIDWRAHVGGLATGVAVGAAYAWSARRRPRARPASEATGSVGPAAEATGRVGWAAEATGRAGRAAEATGRAGRGSEATGRAGWGSEATGRAGRGSEATGRAGRAAEARGRVGRAAEAMGGAGSAPKATNRARARYDAATAVALLLLFAVLVVLRSAQI